MPKPPATRDQVQIRAANEARESPRDRRHRPPRHTWRELKTDDEKDSRRQLSDREDEERQDRTTNQRRQAAPELTQRGSHGALRSFWLMQKHPGRAEPVAQHRKTVGE